LAFQPPVKDASTKIGGRGTPLHLSPVRRVLGSSLCSVRTTLAETVLIKAKKRKKKKKKRKRKSPNRISSTDFLQN
jgi:hypothetical protein